MIYPLLPRFHLLHYVMLLSAGMLSSVFSCITEYPACTLPGRDATVLCSSANLVSPWIVLFFMSSLKVTGRPITDMFGERDVGSATSMRNTAQLLGFLTDLSAHTLNI